MAPRNSRVKVPKEAADITISYGGDEPITYTPDNGIVSVKPEHLDRFLTSVEGSSVVGGSAATTEKE
jgi:hypothetical protein